MALSKSFTNTASSSDGFPISDCQSSGCCISIARSAQAARTAIHLVSDFASGQDHPELMSCPDAAAATQMDRDLFMYCDGAAQAFIIYEDGLIDRPLQSASRKLIRRQPSSAPGTVLPAAMLVTLTETELSDGQVADIIYALSDNTLTSTDIPCAGLYDPGLLNRLVDSLHWHETLQTKEPDAAEEVALLEQKVRQNTFEKQSLDTEKQILQNRLNELDRQEMEISAQREEVFRQMEQLSSRYSQLVTQEKEVETQLRERTLTLIREQMSIHHGLHRK